MNLGFSANGKVESEVGDLLAELDPAVYVIECLSNINAPQVAGRTVLLVRKLRKNHPDVPIILVEDRDYDCAFLKKSVREAHCNKRAALKKAYENLVADGIKDLHYIPADSLLAVDNESTVDGVHPTDLGMMRMADVLTPVLRPLGDRRFGRGL